MTTKGANTDPMLLGIYGVSRIASIVYITTLKKTPEI